MSKSRVGTCMNKLCNRANIQVFNDQEKCSECGEPLFTVNSIRAADSRGSIQEQLAGLLENEPTQMRMPPRVLRPNDTFTCPADLTTCPIAKQVHVYIPMKMFNSWVFLADQLDTEWIAYLIGKEVPDEELTYEITDMYFPKQRATAASVEAEDGEIQEGTIAAVHSHVGMDVFFSGTDIAHMNHLIEMVVNRKSQIIANGRTKLECGRYHRGPATIEFINCDAEVELEEQLRSQLTQVNNTQFQVRKTGN